MGWRDYLPRFGGKKEGNSSTEVSENAKGYQGNGKEILSVEPKKVRRNLGVVESVHPSHVTVRLMAPVPVDRGVEGKYDLVKMDIGMSNFPESKRDVLKVDARIPLNSDHIGTWYSGVPNKKILVKRGYLVQQERDEILDDLESIASNGGVKVEDNGDGSISVSGSIGGGSGTYDLADLSDGVPVEDPAKK